MPVPGISKRRLIRSLIRSEDKAFVLKLYLNSKHCLFQKIAFASV